MKCSVLKDIVIFLFFLSGISGLIYEVGWFKYFAQFIGSTSYSYIMVLVIYMGGLTVLETIRIRLLYGLLEIGIYCII